MKVYKWAPAQCRGKTCLGASNLSWCKIKLACRWASPGLSALRICLGSRSKSKNRDKFITPTVRVSTSIDIKIVSIEVAFFVKYDHLNYF